MRDAQALSDESVPVEVSVGQSECATVTGEIRPVNMAVNDSKLINKRVETQVGSWPSSWDRLQGSQRDEESAKSRKQPIPGSDKAAAQAPL